MRASHRRTAQALALSAAVVVGSMGLSVAPAMGDNSDKAKSAGDGIAQVQNIEKDKTYDRYIVKFKEKATASNSQKRGNAYGKIAKEYGVKVKELRTMTDGAQVIDLSKELSSDKAKAFMNKLVSSTDVEYIEPDILMKPTFTPNDSRYNDQWHYYGEAAGMNLPATWDKVTGEGVNVAVIDTGITYHSDLAANVLPGYDFISEAGMARDGNGRDNDASDEGDWYAAGECGGNYSGSSSWHGTHVAGTIGAVTNNNKGVAGVAYDSNIIPVRVLGKCGGYLSDIADAIIWSSGGSVSGVPSNPNKADVINMSLGGSSSCSSTYQNAINGAVSRGTTVVVAAGNANQNAANSNPGNCDNVINVAASDRFGNRAPYSNYGADIDVTAPGGDTSNDRGVLSTINTGSTRPSGEGYAEYQGTSMATPHVAGLVALLNEADSSLTPAEIETLLKDTARPLAGTCSGGCGAGLVDSAAAVNAVIGGETPDPDPVGGNLLLNPGFEAGSSNWVSNDSDTFESRPGYAHSGSGYAALNQWGYRTTYTLDQQFKVPSNGAAAQVDFYLAVLSNETTRYSKYDTLRVQVISNSGTRTLATYSNLDKGQGYVKRTLDLNGYAGQTVKLRFLGQEDSYQATGFYIDDVNVSVK